MTPAPPPPPSDVFNALTARWLAAGLAPIAIAVGAAGVAGGFLGLAPSVALATGWVCGSAVGVPLAGWTARSLCDRASALEAALRARDIDVTEARAVAEQARTACAAFVNTMNHELRTPLNAIMGFGHLLDVSALTGDQRECLQQVLRGGRHLLSLVNELPQVADEDDPLAALQVNEHART